jgi:hypothetical protein
MFSRSSDPVDSRDVARRFPGRTFAQVKKFAGLVDGSPVYFRQGTPTSRGLQITIRVNEPFGQSIVSGQGFLCVNRGRCFLIPHSSLKSWLGGKLTHQTVDIFLDIETEVLSTADVEPMGVGQFVGS